MQVLASQAENTIDLMKPLDEQRAATFAYASGKWTVKQVLGHIIDTERIFAYRALRVARNDASPLEGFEQDDYVKASEMEHRRMADLFDEFRTVRAASISLFKSFAPEAWLRRGLANQFPFSVRGLIFQTAGHELHHVKILRERYLL